MDITEKQVSSETLFTGKIITVKLDNAMLCDGRIVKREVVEHAQGVAVLPVDNDGNCYLVRQYRYPCELLIPEVPAGKVEPGEDPLECGKRELAEETGFSAENYHYVGAYYVSPGFTTEKDHIYIATELSAGSSHPDDGEYLLVEKYSLKTLLDMVDRNELEDAKTAIAVLRAARLLGIE